MTAKSATRAKKTPYAARKRGIILILAAIAAFAALGLAYLTNSGAAAFVTAREAESGTRAGNAATVSDGGASGGQAVKFGNSTGGGGGTGGGSDTGVPARTIKIMPFGSSTISSSGSNSGFRLPLYQLLTADKLKVDYVGSQSNGEASLPDKDHEGHAGWVIGTGGGGSNDLSRIVVDRLKQYNPDVIIFYAGTNDIRGGLSGAGARDRLDTIANKIFTQSPNVKLIVGKLIILQPPNFTTAQSNGTKEFNNLIEAVAAKHRAQGRYMQISEAGAAVGPGGVSPDGIHASPSGYKNMAGAWHANLKAAYPYLQ